MLGLELSGSFLSGWLFLLCRYIQPQTFIWWVQGTPWQLIAGATIKLICLDSINLEFVDFFSCWLALSLLSLWRKIWLSNSLRMISHSCKMVVFKISSITLCTCILTTDYLFLKQLYLKTELGMPWHICKYSPVPHGNILVMTDHVYDSGPIRL